MKISKVGDWQLARILLTRAPQDVKDAMRKALLQEGQHFAGLIKKHIQAGPTPPLKGPRLAGPGAGGSKPLNASGDMLGSVTSIEEGTADKMRVFVGIPRNRTSPKRGSGGRFQKTAGVVQIAEIHENGATIVMKMTPKMRKFLFGVLFKDKSKAHGGAAARGFLIIHIPARPFIRPAFEEGSEGAGGRFLGRVAALLGGRYGTP